MKKSIYVLTVLMLVLFFAYGCNNKEEVTKKTSNNVINQVGNNRKLGRYWNGRLGRYSAGVPMEILNKGWSEDTVLYSRFNFFDYKNLNEIILCNKPNCKHYDDSCNACIKMNNGFAHPLICGYKDKILLITNREIYSVNEDGTNHKIFLKLPNYSKELTGDSIEAYLDGEILYLQAQRDKKMKFDKNGDPLEGESPFTFVVSKINLKDKSVKIVHEYDYEYSDNINQEWIGVSNNKAYYFYQYGDFPPSCGTKEVYERTENEVRNEVFSIDLETGKKNVVFDGKAKKCYHPIMINDFIYYQDRTKGEIVKCNLKNNKKKVLVKNIFQYVNFLEIGVKNNKLFYEIDNDCLDSLTHEKNKDNTSYVDIDTCKVNKVDYEYKQFYLSSSNLKFILLETPENFIVPIKEVENSKDSVVTYFGKISKKDFWNKNYKVEKIDYKWKG